MLALDHVSYRDLGEPRTSLSLTVRRRTRNGIAQRVDCNHEIAGTIHQPLGPKRTFQLLGLAEKPGGEQDGVASSRIQSAERAVADSAVFESRAGLQTQVAN